MKDNLVETTGESISKVPFTKPGNRLKCSYCGTSFVKNESPFTPFCSKRCQQIDLGKWLTESYGLPIEGSEEEFPSEYDEDGFEK